MADRMKGHIIGHVYGLFMVMFEIKSGDNGLIHELSFRRQIATSKRTLDPKQSLPWNRLRFSADNPYPISSLSLPFPSGLPPEPFQADSSHV